MSRNTFILLVGAAAAMGGVTLVLWLWLVPDAHLVRAQLRMVGPRVLELTFLLMLIGVVWNRRSIVESLPKPRWLPLVVFGLALAAVIAIPPQTHRIYYDEDIYQNVAQNIVWHGRAQMCNEATIRAGSFQCDGWEYNKEPNGFPFLLSIGFRVAGVSETVAHSTNHIVFALGALGVFWLTWILFESVRAAFAASLAFMLTPQNLMWAATVAAEPSAATTAVLALGAWVFFCREPGASRGFLAASSLAFACQFRPESGLVLVAAAAYGLIVTPKILMRRELWMVIVAVFLLLIPHFAHLWSVRNENWGSEEAKFAAKHVPGNFETNAKYYVEGQDFPPAFTVLALLGLVAPGRRREAVATLGWFRLFFVIFVPFYAGSYRYGADVRFAFVSAAPLAVLAGVGTSLAFGWIRKLGASHRVATYAPALVIVYAFSSFLPLTRAIGAEAFHAREDHDAILEMLEHVPDDGVVLSHNPGMIQVMGRSSAQTSLATYQAERLDRFFHTFSGGVYFHYNFWCNVPDEVQNAFCTDVLANYRAEVIAEDTAGFYRYVLYRLLPKSSPPPPPAPPPPSSP